MVLAGLRAGEPFTTAMEASPCGCRCRRSPASLTGWSCRRARDPGSATCSAPRAADAREQHKRDLIEAGGRREVLMLVPVVFLMLPVVVLFALYPGLFTLSRLAR